MIDSIFDINYLMDRYMLEDKKVDWVRFGNILKERRKEKSLTQSDIALTIGISQPAISLIERGSPVGLNEDKQTALFSIYGIVEDDIPLLDVSKIDNSNKRKNVFISYSSFDKSYLNRLLVHLKPLEKKGLIDAWSDKKITVGDKWCDEIEKALNASQVAILLISADFLASDFIVDDELAPILKKQESEGLSIIPVVLKPCRFERDKSISIFQAINSPTEPLTSMDEHNRELIYDAVSERIEQISK